MGVNWWAAANHLPYTRGRNDVQRVCVTSGPTSAPRRSASWGRRLWRVAGGEITRLAIDGLGEPRQLVVRHD